MNPISIFYPLFAMFVLVNLVCLRLLFTRLGALKKKSIPENYFKIFRGGDATDSMVAVSRNLANLFEMPLLFYLVVVLLYVTQTVDATTLALAWAYVGFRYVHSLIHVTFNHVKLRFAAYLFSNLILFALWIDWFVRVIT